jgi:hypothetical protein
MKTAGRSKVRSQTQGEQKRGKVSGEEGRLCTDVGSGGLEELDTF